MLGHHVQLNGCTLTSTSILVTHERHGREVLYMPDAACLEKARIYLALISAGWDRAIES
jgi:hypothetical protein